MNKEGISAAHEMILNEANGDASILTKRLTRQLKNPAKASKECYQAVLFTIEITFCLAIKDWQRLLPSSFMDNFLKDDLVLLVTQFLVFLSEDVDRPWTQRVIREESCLISVEHCLEILCCCTQSRNGPHWVAVMMKNGFLWAIAGLAVFPQHMKSGKGSIIEELLDRYIPRLFCHRFVVLSAIKAIKEVTENGSAETLGSSCIQKPWRNFESILLDRTIFNGIYERDFAERDVLQCSHVSRLNFFKIPVNILTTFSVTKARGRYSYSSVQAVKQLFIVRKSVRRHRGNQEFTRHIVNRCRMSGIVRDSFDSPILTGALQMYRFVRRRHEAS